MKTKELTLNEIGDIVACLGVNTKGELNFVRTKNTKMDDHSINYQIHIPIYDNVGIQTDTAKVNMSLEDITRFRNDLIEVVETNRDFYLSDASVEWELQHAHRLYTSKKDFAFVYGLGKSQKEESLFKHDWNEGDLFICVKYIVDDASHLSLPYSLWTIPNEKVSNFISFLEFRNLSKYNDVFLIEK